MAVPFEIPEWLVAQSALPPPPPVDDHRVEGLVNGFIAGKQDALFDAPDAYYRSQGRDAVDGAPAIVQRLQDLRSATLDRARDDGERAALGPRLDAHLSDAMDGIGRHLDAQQQVLQRKVIAERQGLIQRAADLEHDNDDKIAGLAGANASAAQERARLDGVEPGSDDEAEILNAARSQILRTAIEQRIANAKGQQALGLYDRMSDALTPADRRALELPIAATRDDTATDAWLAREAAKDGPPLADRAASDDGLTDRQRLILQAKIGARESAAESHRVATVKGLDDQLAAATKAIATQPSQYRIGTLNALAQAYDAAGESDKANDTRRLAAVEPLLLPFAQSNLAAQQRRLDDFTGPERATAEAIMNHQAEAFAKDPYAAGTALYPDVGPALPHEDAEGRLRQTRMIAARRGTEADVLQNHPVWTDGAPTPGVVESVARPNDVQLVEATPDDFRPLAPSNEPSGTQVDLPPRRGTAVDPEPPPGSEARETAEEAQKELLPEVGGPVSGLSHWLFGGGEAQHYPFDKIDTSSVSPEKFPAVQKILREGKPGTYEVQGTMPFWAGQNFDSRFLVGRITLQIKGKLILQEGGSYSFQGELGARPDRYRMYDSNRDSVGEAATRAGRVIGALGHDDYSIYITGKKPISSSREYAP